MTTTSILPFARPDIDAETIGDVIDVLISGWITSGPKVKAFEDRLSELFGGRPVRAFASGTSTLEVALRIADIGPGDEVITTSLTWVATANVIVAVGATPIFVDVDPLTRNIDLEAIETAITSRTKAIIPVYLAGLPVDMGRMYALAAAHGLRVIEDAAQAIDSRWGEQRIGSFGDLASFSFQANKNITCAEGGCLVMNSDSEVELAERLRLQGVVKTGFDGMDVEVPGGKCNMTDINAAIGLGQLKHLDEVSRKRARLAEVYLDAARSAGLPELGVELPLAKTATGAITNWHMFQVLLPVDRLVGGRAGIMKVMAENGIGTGVHYPALHLFSFYRSLGWREGMLPHTERLGRSTLTLPLFPSLLRSDVERVVACLAQACRQAMS